MAFAGAAHDVRWLALDRSVRQRVSQSVRTGRPVSTPDEAPIGGRLLRGEARLALAARPSATVPASGCTGDLRRTDGHADSPDLALDRSRARIRALAVAHAAATATTGRCPDGERASGCRVGPDADTCAPAWRVLAPPWPTAT